MDNFDQQSSVNMQGLNRFLSRMYGYMAGAIAISAIMAFITVKYLPFKYNQILFILIHGKHTFISIDLG